MNLEAIKAAATSKAAVAIFKGKKYSPQILFGAGVVGFGATIVLAVRATNKVSEKVGDAEIVKTINEKKLNGGDLTEEQFHSAQKKMKVTLAGDIAKTYALPIAVGLISLGCFGGAHYILNKRNGVLLAAYAGLDRAYSEYRKAVIDEVGEEREREIYLGVEEIERTETLADGSTVVDTVSGINPKRANGRSPYAVCYDEKSRFFTPEPHMNEHILEIKRSQANDKLVSNGHLFLNEVYDLLGLPRTPQGAIVGWIYDPRNERPDAAEIKRDSFVSFGMWLNDPDYTDAIVDGFGDMGIWLDFNVEGPIWDRI